MVASIGAGANVVALSSVRPQSLQPAAAGRAEPPGAARPDEGRAAAGGPPRGLLVYAAAAVLQEGASPPQAAAADGGFEAFTAADFRSLGTPPAAADRGAALPSPGPPTRPGRPSSLDITV